MALRSVSNSSHLSPVATVARFYCSALLYFPPELIKTAHFTWIDNMLSHVQRIREFFKISDNVSSQCLQSDSPEGLNNAMYVIQLRHQIKQHFCQGFNDSVCYMSHVVCEYTLHYQFWNLWKWCLFLGEASTKEDTNYFLRMIKFSKNILVRELPFLTGSSAISYHIYLLKLCELTFWGLPHYPTA